MYFIREREYKLKQMNLIVFQKSDINALEVRESGWMSSRAIQITFEQRF